MRGWLAIAALVAGLSVSPAWAQRHGGGGFGGRSGVSGGSAMGFRGAVPVNRGFRVSSGVALRPGFGFRGPGFSPNRGFFPNRAFFFPNRFLPGRFYRGYPWYYGSAGFYFGYPGYYADYAYPMSYDSYPSYAEPPYVDPSDQVQQEQIDRLEDEVQRLRDQRETAAVPRPSPAAQPSSRSTTDQPTVLVFKDKHTQEVHNYAVVGQTLWIFTEQRASKIPLTTLDLAATAKSNDERGIDFQLPER